MILIQKQQYLIIQQKKSGIEADLHSIFSTKNNETNSSKHDDLINPTTSPENSSYYDVFTSSIQQFSTPIDHLIIKDEEENKIDEDFEELYQRYVTNLNEYETMVQEIDEYEQKQHMLTPISEESLTLFNPFHLTLTVQRQSNHIGHYGFELEETFDKKIKIFFNY